MTEEPKSTRDLKLIATSKVYTILLFPKESSPEKKKYWACLTLRHLFHLAIIEVILYSIKNDFV